MANEGRQGNADHFNMVSGKEQVPCPPPDTPFDYKCYYQVEIKKLNNDDGSVQAVVSDSARNKNHDHCVAHYPNPDVRCPDPAKFPKYEYHTLPLDDSSGLQERSVVDLVSDPQTHRLKKCSGTGCEAPATK